MSSMRKEEPRRGSRDTNTVVEMLSAGVEILRPAMAEIGRDLHESGRQQLR
jgi:hypothetical protein